MKPFNDINAKNNMNSNMNSNITFRIACIAAALIGAAAPAAAAGYPAKPIRIIVPFGPGGSSDIQARIIGQKLTEAWGQPVIVDNRGGAGGIAAATISAQAVPDGHTLFLGHVGTQAANPSLYQKLPYDPAKDFAAVVQTVTQPMVLVVPPESAATSVAALVAMARSEPGKLQFASAGNGSPNHIAGEMFKAFAKLDLGHVPYKGSSPAELDVMAGRVPMFFDTMLAGMPLIKSGRLKALAVTGAKRSPARPELPTMAEAGIARYEFMTWNGFFAPVRTPEAVVMQLNREIVRVMAMPDVQKRIVGDGAEIASGSPQAFAAYVKAEREKLAKVISEAGIRID